MKSAYLVDTDLIIDHLNRRESARRILKELKSSGIAVSMISIAELFEGVYNSKDPVLSQNVLGAFLHQFEIVGIDEDTCKIFGHERGRLRRQGMMIDNFDLIIASTCLRLDLTLLTNNRKHFEHVIGLKIRSLS
jgi:tRNA(fMet)-specific endonuclease VapC